MSTSILDFSFLIVVVIVVVVVLLVIRSISTSKKKGAEKKVLPQISMELKLSKDKELMEIEELLREGVISQEDYEAKKKQLLQNDMSN